MSATETGSRTALSLLLAVFFASGFAALLYQVVWQRMLALFSGADVFSVTIVVSAFMAGLGLGNFAGGHLADRLPRARCLALFAAAELAIALFAFASKALYYDLLYVRLGEVALPMPALAGVLLLAVAWPTFFMGVSLPLLARALTPQLEAAARVVASLYGWNTLGAAVGAFTTTWLLLRRFDLPTCIRIGAAINLACAAAALPLWRALAATGGAGAPEGPAPAAVAALESRARAPLFGVRAWLVLYALSGAVALSLEIAWFRVLGVIAKSTSFTFGTLLGIYLLGVGSGSVVGARLVARGAERPAARFLAIQAGITVYAALSLALLVAATGRLPALAPLQAYFQEYEPLRIGVALAELARHPVGAWTATEPGAALARIFVALYFVLPFLLVAPPTFAMGLAFPYLQRAVQTEARFLGRRVGWLQTANIAGSLSGSLFTGFALLPAVGTSGTFRALAAAAGVFLLLQLRAETGRSRAALAAGALAWVAALVALPGSTSLWAKLHGSAPETLVHAEDAAGVSVIRPRAAGEPEGEVVMAGGLALSLLPYGAYEGAHTLLGALPVLLHPAPRRIAVIGLGSGDTSFAAAARPEVEEVVTIEIVASQLDVLRELQARRSDAGLARLLDDPRHRLVVGDGRSFLRRSTARFDVIEADALRPSSAYAGNLYSLEYFALLRGRLAPGGFAVTWLPTTRVLDTFVRSFPHVLVVSELAIGSESPIPFDREALLARCDEPAVRAHFESAGVDLRALVEKRLAARAPVVFRPEHDRRALRDVNSDLFPKDEFLVGGKSW